MLVLAAWASEAGFATLNCTLSIEKFFCLYKLLLVPNRINFGYMHYTSGTYRWQESVSFAEDCFVLLTAEETIVLPTKKKENRIS